MAFTQSEAYGAMDVIDLTSDEADAKGLFTSPSNTCIKREGRKRGSKRPRSFEEDFGQFLLPDPDPDPAPPVQSSSVPLCSPNSASAPSVLAPSVGSACSPENENSFFFGSTYGSSSQLAPPTSSYSDSSYTPPSQSFSRHRTFSSTVSSTPEERPLRWKQIRRLAPSDAGRGARSSRRRPIRVAAISDLHELEHKIKMPEPDPQDQMQGDVLLIAGDIARHSTYDYKNFFEWLDEQRFHCKIVIAGNHDKIFWDRGWDHEDMTKGNGALTKEMGNNPARKERTRKMFEAHSNVFYLEDDGIEFEGWRFWGSPWTPWSSKYLGVIRKRHKKGFEGVLAFSFTGPSVTDEVQEAQLRMKWSKIPMDADVLLTHTPPFKILDFVNGSKENVGCPELKRRVEQLATRGALKLHVFGHVHAQQKRTATHTSTDGRSKRVLGDMRREVLGAHPEKGYPPKMTFCNVAVNRGFGHPSTNFLRKPLCFKLMEEGCTLSKSGGNFFIPEWVPRTFNKQGDKEVIVIDDDDGGECSEIMGGLDGLGIG